MFQMITSITDFLWGIPLMVAVVLLGLYLTIRVGFFQITGIKMIFDKTVKEMLGKGKSNVDDAEGSMKPTEALSTVLAGTIGSGNIAGVASAIAIGGPGAVFWMWIIALAGMITKMAEVSLAVHYRKKGENGEFYGGPMHYIKNGMKNGSFLAGIFSVALLVLVIVDACFVQTNTLASSAHDVFGIPLILTGVILVIISIAVIAGGTKRIGVFCSKIVPPMVIFYIIGTLGVIILNIQNVPEVFGMIIKYAFSPAPAVGGFAGATISLAMARGASRGIFSNEAGMGTATTVHATAKTDHPIHQGMYGIFEVFLDTIVVCTLTALAILTSGVWSSGDTGVILTFSAFRSVWGSWGIYVLGISVILFTFSSYLGFFVEYKTCIEHVFGEKSVKYLQWLYFIPPILAVTMDTEMIWTLADIAVGFIIIPNLIALIALSNKFVKLFKEYINKENQINES